LRSALYTLGFDVNAKKRIQNSPQLITRRQDYGPPAGGVGGRREDPVGNEV